MRPAPPRPLFGFSSAFRHLGLQQRRQAHQAEAERVFNYPYEALEEALVNAVYHRSYEQREPIEVRVNPDRIEILSYPGSDASISLKALAGKKVISRRYRNRRIGEFLKELELTEGRGTGIPKIYDALNANGSPAPRFETDEGRTYFLAEILIHPAFPARSPQVSDEDIEELRKSLGVTEFRILELLKQGPKNSPEIAASFGYSVLTGNIRSALSRLQEQGLIEFTLPDKPQSKRQQRRLLSVRNKRGEGFRRQAWLFTSSRIRMPYVR